MNVREYCKLQTIATEMSAPAIIDGEMGDLHELNSAIGILYSENRRALEFVELSLKFLTAIKQGRVKVHIFEYDGRVHPEVELLPPR